jgi:hypothetical protein
MADSSTPNYNFVLPEVGGSDDSWGTKLNANWTDVDALMAAFQADIDSRLPKAGGTITGPLTLNANTLTPLIVRGRTTDQLSQIDFRDNANLTAQAWAVRALPTSEGSLQFRHNDQPRMTLFSGEPAAVGGRLQVFGPLFVAAPTADYSSMRLPPGVAPSAPAAGDIWMTSADLFARINGVTETLTKRYATQAEARAGAVSDKLMSPALVEARSGVQTIQWTTQAITFNALPPEATEAILQYSVNLASGVTVDFSRPDDLVSTIVASSQLFGASYSPPTSTNAIEAPVLTTTTAATLLGVFRLSRNENGGQWLMTGEHRYGGTRIGTFGQINPPDSLFGRCRLRAAPGTPASGSAILRWRI